MELYEIMNKFSGKNIDDVDIKDLSDLQYILENLPKDVDYVIKGNKDEFIDSYVYDRIDNFLKAPDEDYDKIEGKCFFCEHTATVIKVLHVMKGDELKDFDKVEFVYEKYEQYRDGSWHCKDYLNLQEDAKGDHPANMNEYYSKYKKYADISPNADINFCSEDMYQLGKDGNIYVDYSCGGDFYVYKPCRESKFMAAKEEAFDNDGDYVVE